MSILKKNLSKKLLCVLLAVSMVLPGMIPAVAYGASAAGASGKVTVTIEYIGQDGQASYLLQPKTVDFHEGMTALEALQAGYEDSGEVAYDSLMWEIVVTPEGQEPIGDDYGGDSARVWTPFADSDRLNTVNYKPASGSVIRLIYGKINNSDILDYSDGNLTIKKDDLISNLAAMTDQQISENHDLYDEALNAALVNSDAGQSEVNDLNSRIRKIVSPDVNATEVEILPDTLSLEIGGSSQLTAKLTPEDAADKVTWSSSDEKVALVDETGKVYGIGRGTAVITASVSEGVNDNITVTVSGTEIQDITLDKTEAVIEEGGSTQLTAAVTPSGSSEQITYESSAPEVAFVNGSGLVVGKSEGEAVITAKAGSAETDCKITVTARKQAEEPAVIFRHKDGRITQMDGGTMTLTPLDEGSFEIEGAENVSRVRWECSEQVNEDGYISNIIHIGTDGTFYPVLGQRTAYVYITDTQGKTSEMTFQLKVTSSEISEIQVYYKGVLLDDPTPVYIIGSDTKNVYVKGKKKDSGISVDIPVQALETSAPEGAYIGADYTGNVFSIGTESDAANGQQYTFSLKMIDDESVSAQFRAVAQRVDVDSIAVNVSEVYYIDSWNPLGEQYSGVTSSGSDSSYTYSLNVTPANASDKGVTWISHDPEVAEFQASYGNGIVPKKAGTARFTVTSADDPSVTTEVTVRFEYKHPLMSVTSPVDEYEMVQYGSVELDLDVTPANATETRFVWTYSQDGIVSVKDMIKSSGNSDGKKTTTHTMTALQPGTVTVTGTPVDDTAGAQPVIFTVNVGASSGKPEIDFDKYVTENINHSVGYLRSALQDNYYYEAEWGIFTLLRTGQTISQADINSYCSSLLEELNSGSRLVPTDYFRIIMALSAMGKDPTDFEGINILERMYDYNNLSNYTSNMMSFTLMAYDSMDFEIPQDAMWSREELIDMILAFQNQENGGFGLADNKTVSVDMTAMALQALVPYNTDQYPKVQAAFEKGLDYLRGQMLSDCGFYVEGANNGCSAAQVLMLLCEAGIDPLDPDNGFVRDGATLITKLNDFKLESGYTTFEGSSTADGMATYQIGCALESYRRFAEGENRLFDLTDVARQDQAEIDKIAASETEDLISAIGEVTAESGEAIRKARRAYDLLSEDQKALVNNYDVLLAAEEQFALLSGDGSGSQNGGTSADASGSSGGSDAESTIPKTSDRNDLYGALAGLVISAASILLLRKRKAEKNCGNMM